MSVLKYILILLVICLIHYLSNTSCLSRKNICATYLQDPPDIPRSERIMILTGQLVPMLMFVEALFWIVINFWSRHWNWETNKKTVLALCWRFEKLKWILSHQHFSTALDKNCNFSGCRKTSISKVVCYLAIWCFLIGHFLISYSLE